SYSEIYISLALVT
ncbi:hypothetical protein CGCVW01_v009843, partial [Colletotrichum viniferum]